MNPTRTVLFVCVHNAGRSQMAAGFLTALARGAVQVLSAGSEPADQLNPVAVAAMAEDGIDITAGTPTLLTTDAVRESDVVITMGCGDTPPSRTATAELVVPRSIPTARAMVTLLWCWDLGPEWAKTSGGPHCRAGSRLSKPGSAKLRTSGSTLALFRMFPRRRTHV